MRISRPVAALVVGVGMILLVAVTLDAQTRRAVPRSSRRVSAPPTRSVHVRGGFQPYYYGYYGPQFFGPYYPFPFYGYPYYGRAYARSSVRLQVKPEETEVYVDGYYAGVVDSYDGFFQRLHLPPGEHEIELYLEGHESVQERLYLVEGETYKLNHAMVPLAAGAPPPTRPQPVDPPPSASAGPYRPERGVREPQVAPLDARQFGTLAVRVQPRDAEVLVDGERWQGFEGLDRLVVELGVGPHVVEVYRDGYRSFRSEVEIVEAETTVLNVSLPPDGGRP